jgi:hypothetical protein
MSLLLLPQFPSHVLFIGCSSDRPFYRSDGATTPTKKIPEKAQRKIQESERKTRINGATRKEN